MPSDRSPPDTIPKDTGTKDTGTKDTGTKDTGTKDTGTKDTGPTDNRPPNNHSAASCPLPQNSAQEFIGTAHGNGGQQMKELIESQFKKLYLNPWYALCDGANLPAFAEPLCLTTDSYVVKPLFFPGGDIGSLAVCGTCNDLAMMGAKPKFLAVSFILEEGLARSTLAKITASMEVWSQKIGVEIVTGDTKVVERGKGDQVFITTTGLGTRPLQPLEPRQISSGDCIIVSGDIGRHGVAVMSARDGIDLEVGVESDMASLWEPVEQLQRAGVRLQCLRDLTRGGLATALNELAEAAHLGCKILETSIPIIPEVQAYCTILGFDPCHLACEGRFIAIVPPSEVKATLSVLGPEARYLGAFSDATDGQVLLETAYGSHRPLRPLSGELLPRIC